MVCQAFNLLGHLLPGARFQGLDNPGMQRPSLLLEEAPICYLLDERMLEGVGPLGHKPRLVEQLRRLEVRQVLLHSVLGQLGERLHERHGHFRTNHSGHLEQGLRHGR
jgi:hypothetical protein